jgi:HAD superfamily hydrolase (TIGR01509 family)
MNTDEKNESKNPLIDDVLFYKILARASGKPTESIRTTIPDTSVLNTELLTLIKKLKSDGYKIGLATNADQRITREFLEAYYLFALFDTVVTSSEAGKRKPDPAMLNKISLFLSIRLSEMLLIDDNLDGVQKVKEFSMQAIHYRGQTAEELQQEIQTFSHLKALT